MSIVQDDLQEGDISIAALAALTAAQRHAAQSGRTRVVLENGRLLRKTPGGTILIKTIAPRKKVAVRVKRAHPILLP